MNQRIRLIAAAAVMLVGLGSALCFRRVPGETTLTIPSQNDGKVAAKAIASRDLAAEARSATVYPAPRLLPVVANQPRRAAPTAVAPSLQPVPPPEFPKSYPGLNQVATARWGASIDQTQPESASPHLTHKIVDGDTLPLLAERYLGSASRANEIYEANRGVLAEGPGLLPVTKILKIPIGDKAGSIERGAGSTEQ